MKEKTKLSCLLFIIKTLYFIYIALAAINFFVVWLSFSLRVALNNLSFCLLFPILPAALIYNLIFFFCNRSSHEAKKYLINCGTVLIIGIVSFIIFSLTRG
jgi:hypothetical protein